MTCCYFAVVGNYNIHFLVLAEFYVARHPFHIDYSQSCPQGCSGSGAYQSVPGGAAGPGSAQWWQSWWHSAVAVHRSRGMAFTALCVGPPKVWGPGSHPSCHPCPPTKTTLTIPLTIRNGDPGRPLEITPPSHFVYQSDSETQVYVTTWLCCYQTETGLCLTLVKSSSESFTSFFPFMPYRCFEACFASDRALPAFKTGKGEKYTCFH